MSDKRKYISSTSEQDTSINTSVNSPPEVKKPKKKKGKGNAKKQKMAEANEELKCLSKSIEEINRKLCNTLTKDDKICIQEIIVDTLDQMREKLLGFIINRVEKNECDIHDKATENATLKKKLDKMQVKFEGIKVENDRLKQQLHKELSLHEENINFLEQNGKRNNVCITGLEDTSGETAEMTTKKVVNMVNSKLPIKISENEIDISHRLGKFENNKNRPIVVKFIRRHVQNALMKNSKMLKGTNIYVNEDLTKLNRNVLTSMRKKSMDTVERAWSFNGKLFWKDKYEKIEEVKFKDFAFWLSLSWPEKETLTTEM